MRDPCSTELCLRLPRRQKSNPAHKHRDFTTCITQSKSESHRGNVGKTYERNAFPGEPGDPGPAGEVHVSRNFSVCDRDIGKNRTGDKCIAFREYINGPIFSGAYWHDRFLLCKGG